MEADKSESKLDLVWGAVAIGRVIDRKPRQTFFLLESGQLPARKCGGRWCASREALRRHFAVPAVTTEAA